MSAQARKQLAARKRAELDAARRRLSRPPTLAEAAAALEEAKAEFPDWYFQHVDQAHGGGWAARMGQLTVRGRTLGEVVTTLRG